METKTGVICTAPAAEARGPEYCSRSLDAELRHRCRRRFTGKSAGNRAPPSVEPAGRTAGAQLVAAPAAAVADAPLPLPLLLPLPLPLPLLLASFHPLPCCSFFSCAARRSCKAYIQLTAPPIATPAPILLCTPAPTPPMHAPTTNLQQKFSVAFSAGVMLAVLELGKRAAQRRRMALWA